MKRAPLALALGFLLSCASAPSPTDLAQSARSFVQPEPLGAATVEARAEPLGLRWTFFRATADQTERRLDGTAHTEPGPAPDLPLGLEFPGGVFLDAAGNLSLLPPLPRDSAATVGYFRTRGDVWSAPMGAPSSATPTASGTTVSKTEWYGTSSVEVLAGPPLRVEGWVVAHEGDTDRLWQDGPLRTWDRASFTRNATGVTQTIGGILPQKVEWTASPTGIRSSDGFFTMTPDQDHWVISWQGRTWWLFEGDHRGELIDLARGRTFQWEEGGTELRADRGWIARWSPSLDRSQP